MRIPGLKSAIVRTDKREPIVLAGTAEAPPSQEE